MSYSKKTALMQRLRKAIEIQLGYKVDKVSVRESTDSIIRVTVKDKQIPLEDIQEIVGDLGIVDYKWDLFLPKNKKLRE